MIEYNFYIKAKGEAESQAVKQNFIPSPTPKFVQDPNILGDGDWVALIEVIKDGVSLGFRYRREFTITGAFVAFYRETGVPTIVSVEDGDNLFIANYIEWGGFQETINDIFGYPALTEIPEAIFQSGVSLLVDESIDAPTNFSISYSDLDFSATWDAVGGADGYNVFVKREGGIYLKVNDSLILTNSLSQQYLHEGTHEAYVVAVKSGVVSAPSTSDTFVVNFAPQNFSASVVGSDIQLSWDAVFGADGYNVYLREPFGEYSKINSSLIGTNSYQINSPADNSYYIQVSAVVQDLERGKVIARVHKGDEIFTDFSEDELEVKPSGWTVTGGGGTWTVQEKGDAEGGRALRFTGASSGDNYLRYDIPVLEDMLVEGRLLAETKGSSSRLRVLSRAGSNVTSYFAELTGFSSYEHAIQRHISGTFSSLENDSNANSWAHSTWYRMKIEVIGTQIRTKFWVDGELEPDWILSTTDSGIDDGRAGVAMRVSIASAIHWMDWIKITNLD